MPYKNPYNAGIAKQVRGLAQKHVAREKEINDFATDYEIPSQLESSVLHNPEVHGGSGFGAATVADLGFDPTLGATSGEAKPKRRAKKKVIEVGEGLSAAGVSAAGVSGAGVSGGALLSLRDMDKMHGQPKETIRAKTTVPAKPENAAIVARGASPPTSPSGGRSRRNALVRDVMKSQGLSLPAASKYVKEHKLY